MTERNQLREKGGSQRQWHAHVQAYGRSGLSRAEYCRRQKVSYHAMAYWQRKLSKPNDRPPTPLPVLVPVSLAGGIAQVLPRTAHRASLRIAMPGKYSVEVEDGFSPATLRLLLATLEGQ